ncbi:MAG: DUF6694 family lipoprotein [Rheinheimera sp.]|nr:DUF6694 family lipoprotein [Rheinheimera sp.]
MKNILSAILFCLLLGGCSSAGPSVNEVPRVDASSEATFQSSLRRITSGRTEDEKQKLQLAMLAIMLSDLTSAQQLVDNVKYQKMSPASFRDRFAGLSYEEILNKANVKSSVKVSVAGDEPGVPAELLKPLQSDPSIKASLQLAGSRWALTTNINGHVKTDLVEFGANGKLNYVPANTGEHSWEQVGNALRIRFNNGYAVYVGHLENDAKIVGKASNRYGGIWTWVAERQK